MISELKAVERSRAIENATMSDCMRIMKRMQEHVKDPAIKRFYSMLIEKGKLFVEFGDSLAEINHSMMEEASRATKIDPFKPIDEQEKDASQFMPIVQGKHFIRLCFDAVRMFTRAYAELASLTLELEPGEIVASSSDKEGVAQTTEDLKNRLFEYQFNERTIKKYIGAVVGLDAAHDNFLQDVDRFTKTLENYYKYLEQRHRSGIKVHRDAIITDTAHAIFDNVDSHGEITATNFEMSAYTLSKGMLVVEAVNHPLISELIKGPDMLLEWIKGGINAFGQTIDELQNFFRDDVEFILGTIGLVPSSSRGHDYALVYNKIRSANPGSIRSKEDEVFLSQNEKFVAESKEETIAEIVKMIEQKAGGGALLKYIAERKAELKRYFQEENTFYVCQISQGNMFTGEAPGGIKVVPGKRPNIKMEHIVGSGFSEVIDFYESIEAGAKWQKLFIATSPSKSADKSNCLMVGPPGSGKTELMRAIGADKNCIGIFAQGSDFLTCWKGEADKNPKRLFEAALKLHKETNKRVYILIDEIDSVMHHANGPNDINLTLEFQILMDGIVSYPGVSVWGATNNPERIPMAMIRRFNKVSIVGELNKENRVKLLKHFLDSLPQKDFKQDDWDRAAVKLDGATGDVIRQICDHIWRTKIHSFVKKDKDGAVKAIDFLEEREGGFDIDNFSESDRQKFKNVLQKYVNVVPSDVMSSINTHLKSMAIKSEIETAVTTYKAAKQFLNSVNSDSSLN